MRRWMGVGLALVLVLGVTGCYGDDIKDLKQRVTALEASTSALAAADSKFTTWVNSMTIDANPGTTSGTPDDPAYLLLQTRAICALAVRMGINKLAEAQRPKELIEMCFPGGPTEPVFPPGFPPET